MLCTIKQASTFLGYRSTSTMYRLLHSGMLDDYVERIDDETYLDMGEKGRKPTLARHVMTLVNWQADFQVIDFDPKQYIKEEAIRLKESTKQLTSPKP